MRGFFSKVVDSSWHMQPVVLRPFPMVAEDQGSRELPLDPLLGEGLLRVEQRVLAPGKGSETISQ